MTVQALAASTFSLKAISMFLWRFNESLNDFVCWEDLCFNLRVGYLALILTCFFCKVSFLIDFLREVLPNQMMSGCTLAVETCGCDCCGTSVFPMVGLRGWHESLNPQLALVNPNDLTRWEELQFFSLEFTPENWGGCWKIPIFSGLVLKHFQPHDLFDVYLSWKIILHLGTQGVSNGFFSSEKSITSMVGNLVPGK